MFPAGEVGEEKIKLYSSCIGASKVFSGYAITRRAVVGTDPRVVVREAIGRRIDKSLGSSYR